jgi:DNA-binding HxlR family transcriptional regulator
MRARRCYLGDMSAAPVRPVVTPQECLRGDASLARAFQFLGKPWSASVLGALSDGPLGFREISRTTAGISDSMLSNRLASLARAGLINRTVSDGPPVSVTYALTEPGRALMPALHQIAAWAHEHLPADCPR